LGKDFCWCGLVEGFSVEDVVKDLSSEGDLWGHKPRLKEILKNV
jgi:hypothetical protein